MMRGSFLRSFSCLVSFAFVTFKDAESFKLLSLEGEAANLTEDAVSSLSQHDTHAVHEEVEEEAEDEAEDEAEAEEEAEDEAEEEAEEEAEDEAEEEAEDEADEAEDEAENEAIKKVAEDPTVLPAELEAYGPQADLGVAFPVMIQNLSNFSGLLAAPSTDNENITHHFGHLKDDEAMLHDKLSGFITVLHAAMDGQDGPTYCPRYSMKHIKGCIELGLCLLQKQVPEYLETAMYASYVELMDPLLEISLPQIKRNLLKEDGWHNFELDVELPEKYQCNGFTHSHFKAELKATAQLQESEGAHSALGMSAVLARAAASTHEILDSHRHNSSLEATIHKVKHVWRPICRNAHIFSCDENNFWDIHYASHRQTMALMQTGNAAAVHAEIRTRLRVAERVKSFIREHHQEFGAHLQAGSHRQMLEHEKYFDFNRRSNTSLQIWKDYGNAGKAAMHRFVVPYTRSMARVNVTHATICFDQVEFRKFHKDHLMKKLQQETDEETLESEDEELEEIDEEEAETEEDEELELAETDSNVTEEDDKLEIVDMNTNAGRKSSRALLSLRESDSEEAEDLSLSARRRSSRSRRSSRRRSNSNPTDLLNAADDAEKAKKGRKGGKNKASKKKKKSKKKVKKKKKANKAAKKKKKKEKKAAKKKKKKEKKAAKKEKKKEKKAAKKEKKKAKKVAKKEKKAAKKAEKQARIDAMSKEERAKYEKKQKKKQKKKRKRRKSFGRKVGKGLKKAGKKIGKGLKKAADGVMYVVEVVETYISMIFGCIGDVFEFITVGYTYEIVEGILGFGVGLSAGDLVGFRKLLPTPTVQEPTTWVSVDIGFAVGATVKAAWVGAGMGIGVSCGTSSCVAYLAVGILATVNLPTINPICIFGSPYSYTAPPFQCSQVVGASISSFCCNLNIVSGRHDCR